MSHHDAFRLRGQGISNPLVPVPLRLEFSTMFAHPSMARSNWNGIVLTRMLPLTTRQFHSPTRHRSIKWLLPFRLLRLLCPAPRIVVLALGSCFSASLSPPPPRVPWFTGQSVRLIGLASREPLIPKRTPALFAMVSGPSYFLCELIPYATSAPRLELHRRFSTRTH